MHDADEGLIFEGMLPVGLDFLDSFPGDDQLALLNEQNENFLKTSLVWHETVDVDEFDDVGQELKRQDLKINLLLDMVGELLALQNKLPETRPIKFSTHALESDFQSEAVVPGAKAMISLYLMPAFPRSVKLYAEFDSTGKAVFCCMSQNVQDGLEKIIFRHHRRMIAQAKLSQKQN